MNLDLDNLSEKELKLMQETILINGTIEEKEQKILAIGIYEKYRLIHNSYLDIFKSTNDSNVKLESLKRLIFINWYSMIEPSIYTGIGKVDNETIYNSYKELDNYITENKLDKEFIWMLSYYSSWDFTILPFSEGKLMKLTKFVENVDNSFLHVPKHQLPKGVMDNRGQMGDYWISCSVEKVK